MAAAEAFLVALVDALSTIVTLTDAALLATVDFPVFVWLPAVLTGLPSVCDESLLTTAPDYEGVPRFHTADVVVVDDFMVAHTLCGMLRCLFTGALDLEIVYAGCGLIIPNVNVFIEVFQCQPMLLFSSPEE